MSSKSSQQRQKMKEKNPKMYAEYLRKQKVSTQKRRAEKKRKWLNEPHTWEMIIEHKRENELNRLRVVKYRSKRAPESVKCKKRLKSKSTKPSDMTEKEKREHSRKLKQESRARQKLEKKEEIKVRDRAYQKAKRDRLKLLKASKTYPNCCFVTSSSWETPVILLD